MKIVICNKSGLMKLEPNVKGLSDEKIIELFNAISNFHLDKITTKVGGYSIDFSEVFCVGLVSTETNLEESKK